MPSPSIAIINGPPPLDDTFQENGDDGSGVAVIRGDGGEMTPYLGGWVFPIFVVQRGSKQRDTQMIVVIVISKGIGVRFGGWFKAVLKISSKNNTYTQPQFPMESFDPHPSSCHIAIYWRETEGQIIFLFKG